MSNDQVSLDTIHELLHSLSKSNASISNRLSSLEESRKRDASPGDSSASQYKRLKLTTPSGQKQTILTTKFSSESAPTGSRQPVSVNSEDLSVAGNKVVDPLNIGANLKSILADHDLSNLDGNSAEESEVELEVNDTLDDSSSGAKETSELLKKILSSVDTPIISLAEKSSLVENSSSSTDLPIIGASSNSNWEVSDRVLQWFKTIADIELTDEQISEISREYVPDNDVKNHFEHPRIPSALYKRIKNKPSEPLRLRPLNRSQLTSTLALKPLLTVLDSMEYSDPMLSHLTKAIQLICQTNLTTGHLRRSLTASAVKPHLRSHLFSQPVTHSHLFGGEFEAVAESALKTQLSSNKLLFNTKRFQDSHVPSTSSGTSSAPAASAAAKPERFERRSFRGKPSRGRGRGTYRGKNTGPRE